MANRKKFSNNGTSTLLANFNIGATTCSVQAGHGARFDTPGANEEFRFTLKDAAGNIEICKCTQRTVDTFNVVARAQEGTTERNWLAGDLVEARITKETLESFSQKDAEETITAKWYFNKVLRLGHGVNVASANNLVLGDDGNTFTVTGSTPINTIATKGIGTIVVLHFASAIQITHHATDMVLPGGANIDADANSVGMFEEYAAGDWRCIGFLRGNGAPITGPLISQKATNYSIVQGDNGKTMVGTGAMTFTLPLISSLKLPFSVTIEHDTTDVTNVVTVSCSGGDVIKAPQASSVASTQANKNGSFITLVADGTSNKWRVVSSRWGFESAELALVQGINQVHSVTHNLGGKPDQFIAYLRNKTSEGGYSPGDEIRYDSLNLNGSNPQSIFADATNIGISRQAATYAPCNKSTGAGFNPADGNWKLVLRAWL